MLGEALKYIRLRCLNCLPYKHKVAIAGCNSDFGGLFDDELDAFNGQNGDGFALGDRVIVAGGTG